MRKLALTLTIALIVLSASLIAVPMVSAACEAECVGCRHTIKVIPVGSDIDGPVITQNPANLMIFHTGNGPIKNVWLLIVLNKPTYDALDKITINGTTFMTKADFGLVSTKKIPPILPKSQTGYPGSLCRYEVSAVKSNMDEDNKPVYDGYKFFLNKITTTPTYFTLTLEFSSPVSDIKALILALGRYDAHAIHQECVCPEPFNACNSFSKSTLVVPEPATMAMAAAPLGALGLLYTIKRKRSN